MSEKFYKELKCERCKKTETIEMKSGFLNIITNPKNPTGWEKRVDETLLCDDCCDAYNRAYQQFITDFMKDTN